MSDKKFIPVIHVVYRKQMSRNIEIARFNGADGVFLINHGSLSTKELMKLYFRAVNDNPDFWIGVNCLDIINYKVFKHVPKSIDGIWIDDGGVTNEGDPKYAKKIAQSIKNSKSECIYFGGCAFKGQGYVKDVGKIASVAKKYMDVVTTSGMGTGKPADLDKIIKMKRAIGDSPLGLASGINISNIYSYLPYVDYFLVSTGISIDFSEFDPLKVKELSNAIHSYNN